MNRHVSESELALVNTGDLSRWKAYRVRRHMSRCQDCASAAAAYGGSHAMLRSLAGESIPAPDWLANRIIARAAEDAEQPSFAAGSGFAGIPFRLALQAGALVSLGVLAVLLMLWPAAPPPSTLTSTQILATHDALIGEARNAQGHQRLEMFTGGGGVSEVSATGRGVNVMQTDPVTGVIRYTRVVTEQ